MSPVLTSARASRPGTGSHSTAEVSTAAAVGPASLSHFLGRGWKFPPTFSRAGGGVPGGVEMAEGEEDIRQSIGIILSTEPGERAMQPDFGCALRQFLFRRLDVTTQTRIQDAVYRALLAWEPRIAVEEVRVEQGDRSEQVVLIGVRYTVRASNSRFNLVFPYDVAEGSRRLE